MTPTLRPSTDPALWPAYRLGQWAACAVAIPFASVHGVTVAGSGLVIALAVFRVFFLIIRGIVFPMIEELARAVSNR